LLHFLKLKKCRNLHLLYNHVELFLLPNERCSDDIDD
jgi:hypothetical protein